MMRYHDIFVPGGFPKYTYNPRVELKLESKLRDVKNNLCKLVPVTGQTKSGKTVLVQNILSREESLWIDGGAVSLEDDFWHVIIEQLELFQATQKDTSDEFSNRLTVKLGGAVSGGIFKGGIGGEIQKGRKKSSGQSISKTLSSRVVALQGLRNYKTPLVVDDFHYIPKDLQGSIIRALKPLIFGGLPVVIIAIPHRRYDALKVEKEMTGRIYPIEIPVWSTDELKFIPNKGFDLLNYYIEDDDVLRLSTESIGSPHLMQDFCRGICKARSLEHVVKRKILKLNDSLLDTVFREVAETIGRPIFEKLARGPRSRTDRKPRELKDGQTVDIYQLVLHGMAYIKPGLVSIEYDELRSAIRNVSSSQIPQLQEISRVLKHMSTIAATDQSSTPVIDFDEDEKKLHITDPFFAFYLRWGTIGK